MIAAVLGLIFFGVCLATFIWIGVTHLPGGR
jgi:hypothetical protein